MFSNASWNANAVSKYSVGWTSLNLISVLQQIRSVGGQIWLMQRWQKIKLAVERLIGCTCAPLHYHSTLNLPRIHHNIHCTIPKGSKALDIHTNAAILYKQPHHTRLYYTVGTVWQLRACLIFKLGHKFHTITSLTLDFNDGTFFMAMRCRWFFFPAMMWGRLFWTFLTIAISAIVSTQPSGQMVFWCFFLFRGPMVTDGFGRRVVKNAHFATDSISLHFVRKFKHRQVRRLSIYFRIYKIQLWIQNAIYETSFTFHSKADDLLCCAQSILYLGCPFCRLRSRAIRAESKLSLVFSPFQVFLGNNQPAAPFYIQLVFEILWLDC